MGVPKFIYIYRIIGKTLTMSELKTGLKSRTLLTSTKPPHQGFVFTKERHRTRVAFVDYSGRDSCEIYIPDELLGEFIENLRITSTERKDLTIEDLCIRGEELFGTRVRWSLLKYFRGKYPSDMLVEDLPPVNLVEIWKSRGVGSITFKQIVQLLKYSEVPFTRGNIKQVNTLLKTIGA